MATERAIMKIKVEMDVPDNCHDEGIPCRFIAIDKGNHVICILFQGIVDTAPCPECVKAREEGKQ